MKRQKIGLFGGTFDPVHSGHMEVARAALRRFRLDIIYFIPCGRPPHKDRPGLTPYLHRYAMAALACAGEPAFRASLAEAGEDLTGRRRSYSIDTVRRLRRKFGARVELFFILGADAYKYLPTWKNFAGLARLCSFIAAARPGFDWRRTVKPLPAAVRQKIYFLAGVRSPVSATAVRRRARRGLSLRGLAPPAVEAYLRAQGLYRRAR